MACGSYFPSCRNCSKFFLGMQVPWRWFNGAGISSLEHFLTCHCKPLSLTPSHQHREGLAAAPCHSLVLYPSPPVLLMWFHYQLILIPLAALLSNSGSLLWQWWVISLLAQPFLDSSDAAALAPGRLETSPCPWGFLKLFSCLWTCN